MNSENEKYNKQIILSQIGTEGQMKLKAAKALVIGAGGIGCPVLSYLTSAGVGTIGVMDYDKVELSNLHRQVLYDESHVGLSKSETAVRKLEGLNSDVMFNVHEAYLNSKNGIGIIKNYDIVLDATDNFRARYLINDFCVELSKPFVMAAVNKFEGQVTVLNHNNGPTYRCIYPDYPKEGSIANCEESGVIGSLCGIIGTIAATEVIKLITGAGILLSGEILFVNSLNMEFRKIKVRRVLGSSENQSKLSKQNIES